MVQYGSYGSFPGQRFNKKKFSEDLIIEISLDFILIQQDLSNK